MNTLNVENLRILEGHLYVILGQTITKPRRKRVWIDAILNGEKIKVAKEENIPTDILETKLFSAIGKCNEVKKIFDYKAELDSLKNNSSASIDMDDIRMQDDEYHGSKTRSYNYSSHRQTILENNIEALEATYNSISSVLVEIIDLIKTDKLLEDSWEPNNKQWKLALDVLSIYK
jgi:hypothetical protein